MIGAQILVVHGVHGICNRVVHACIPFLPEHPVHELRSFHRLANNDRGGVNSLI
jgi:hypothetical protein